MTRFNLRLEDDVYDELKKISDLTGNSMNSVVNLSIREFWTKYGEDPKFNETIAKMNLLKAELEKLQDAFK